jgi:hypothetical protein
MFFLTIGRPMALLGLVVSCLWVTQANAQTAPCEEEVRIAEAEYRDGNFDAAESILFACLEANVVADAVAIAGYRLVALSRLQLGDIPGAQISVLRIFARQPSYLADPVQDPPGYQALVETVRQQLDDVAVRDEVDRLREESLRRRVVVDVQPRTTAYRRAGTMYLLGSTGINSYGGERGVTAGNALSEFGENAGALFAIGVGYSFLDRIAAQINYELGNFPTITDQKARIFPTIDQATSSSWLQTISLQGVVRVLPRGFINPNVRIGPSLSIARINNEVRTGAGFEGAIGADLPISEEVGFFTDLSVRYIYPGDAMDLVARTADHDVFTAFRLGLMWRVGGL